MGITLALFGGGEGNPSGVGFPRGIPEGVVRGFYPGRYTTSPSATRFGVTLATHERGVGVTLRGKGPRFLGVTSFYYLLLT